MRALEVGHDGFLNVKFTLFGSATSDGSWMVRGREERLSDVL